MEIRALGQLMLVGSTLRRPKPLLLLTYLALEGPQPRDFLARLFFRGAEDAADALSTTLRRLRRVGGLIAEEGQLLACAVECDARRVRELLDQGRVEEALHAYTAPFLQGGVPVHGPEVEEWIYATREELAGRVRLARLVLADELVRRGMLVAAKDHLEEATRVGGASEPTPDEWVQMHALAGATRHPLERWFRRMAFQHVAGVEGLDAAPRLSSDTSALPGSNLHGRASIHALARPASLVGRSAELAFVMGTLCESSTRLLSIVGVGGVGKTTLAREVVRRIDVEQAFEDGAYFVPLEAATDTNTMVDAVLGELPVQLQGSAPPELQLRGFLRHKRVLLALDNFEQLTAASSLLTTWLSHCPGLVILITSREALATSDEQLYRLRGLALPKSGDTEQEAAACEAVTFFADAARRHGLSLKLSDAELSNALSICHMVDGLPLALELAASWLPRMELQDIKRELQADLLVESEAATVSPRHWSMRAVLKRSWANLRSDEQLVLGRLAVFVGGFTFGAATEVTGVSGPELASLTRKTMLRSNAEGRFEFHPLVHQFVVERSATTTGIRHGVEAAHAEYYLKHLDARLTSMLDSEFAVGAAASIVTELPNIRAAWGWALTSRRLDLIELAYEALTQFAELHSSQTEALTLFDAAFRHLEGLQSPLAAQLRDNMKAASSILLYRVGDNTSGFSNAAEAQATVRSLPPQLRNPGKWAAYYGAGLTGMLAGKLHPEYFDEAISAARADCERVSVHHDGSPGDATRATSLLGLALTGSAMLANVMGDFDVALSRAQEAREILEPIRSPYLALTYRILHETALAHRDLDEAINWLRLGLAVASAAGYHTEVTSLLCYKVRLLHALGDAEGAQAVAPEAQAAVSRSGDRYMAAFLATLNGWMALGNGDFDLAKRSFRQAIEDALAIKARLVAMEPLAGLAEVAAASGAQVDAVAIVSALWVADGVPYLIREKVRQAIAETVSMNGGKAAPLGKMGPDMGRAAKARPSPEVAALVATVLNA